MPVREWQDGSEIDTALMIRGVEPRTKRDGAEYLKIELGDRTGAVPAMVWDLFPALKQLCCAGAVVRVRGRFRLLSLEHLPPQMGHPGAQLVWETTIEREDGDKPVCVAESVARRYG